LQTLEPSIKKRIVEVDQLIANSAAQEVQGNSLKIAGGARLP